MKKAGGHHSSQDINGNMNNRQNGIMHHLMGLRGIRHHFCNRTAKGAQPEPNHEETPS